MKKIEFDETCINAPTKWQDVLLKNYEKWYLQKPETRTEHILHIADVCKIDVKLILNAPSVIFDILTEAVSFSFNHDYEPKNEATINGEQYWINSSDKLTLGEWVDMDSVINGDGENKLSELLAILCRPIGEDYNPDNVEERSKLFKELSCDKALPLISFFLLKEKKSKQILSHCSQALAQGDRFLQDMENSVKSGAGIKRLRIWQRIRFYFLIRSLRKQLSRFSDSYYTELTKHKQKESK